MPRFVALLLVVSTAASGTARATPPALLADQRPPISIPDPARFLHGKLVLAPSAATANLLALTFDDGPAAATTPIILDELARQGVPATFFVNAYRLAGHSAAARRQRELLSLALARGHDVGNHTYDHQRLSDLPADRQAREILDGEAGIFRVLGEHPSLFRPPYGRMAPEAARLLARRGDTVVLWNLSSEDPYLRRPERVVEQLEAELAREGGGVVLMHDTHPWTAAALPRFFAAIAAENCRRVAEGKEPVLFVTLDRFIHPRYGLPPGSHPAPAPRRGSDGNQAGFETPWRAEQDRWRRQRIADACLAAVPRTTE